MVTPRRSRFRGRYRDLHRVRRNNRSLLLVFAVGAGALFLVCALCGLAVALGGDDDALPTLPAPATASGP